jgi:hypothetical protein
MERREIPGKLLIDIGNSDAIWLFQNRSEVINVPSKSFNDFLGRGFSGDIEGKRARIQKFIISEFEFNNPIVAFPDSSSIKNVNMVADRMGSVGGEILRRFDIVFDYQKQKMYFKKNSEYNSAFGYNKSGVEIQHKGLQWIQETVRLETVPLATNVFDSNDNKKKDFKYKFVLKPIYEIANVRKNSPAEIAGLQKGDVLILINRSPAYKYSLQEINTLFKSERSNGLLWKSNVIVKF